MFSRKIFKILLNNPSRIDVLQPRSLAQMQNQSQLVLKARVHRQSLSHVSLPSHENGQGRAQCHEVDTGRSEVNKNSSDCSERQPNGVQLFASW